MLDEIGYALTPIEPGGTGSVRTHGEIWTATADEPIEQGSPVAVTAVRRLLPARPAAARIETLIERSHPPTGGSCVGRMATETNSPQR